MRSKRFWFFWQTVVFAILFGIGGVRSADAADADIAISPVLTIPSDFGRAVLQGYVDFLPDPEARFTLDELRSTPLAGRFAPVIDIDRSSGFVSGAYWLRFTLQQTGAETRELFLEIAYPYLDKIKLYLPAANGAYTARQTGDSLPFSQRDVDYRNPGFRIALAGPEPQTFYLRIETRGAMAFPMTLWAPQSFLDAAFSERTAMGAFYGVILAMIFYNSFLAIWLRDRPSFYYVLHLTTLALFLFNANGFAFQYLWPNSPALANWSHPVLMLLALLAATQFTRAFLETAERAVWFDRLLAALLIAGFGALVALPFVDYGAMLSALLPFTLLHLALYFATGWWLLTRKFGPARIFLAAFVIEILGAGFGTLRIAGLVPASFWTAYSLQIGSVVEMMLLSLGLAARINFLKKQRELAQIENLRIKQSALDGLRRSEKALEARVQNRTLQLAEANDVLKTQVEERLRAEHLLREGERRMRHLAHHDALTGLANRILLDDRLQVAIARAKRNGTLVAVMLIDLDYFKQINDTLGHDVGDGLLTEVAERLRAVTRADDTVARLSGDEFVIVLADQKAASDAALIAEKIIDMLAKPIAVASHTLHTSPSIGISLYPENGADTKTLLKRADIAMYRAKRIGRKTFCFFGQQDKERTA